MRFKFFSVFILILFASAVYALEFEGCGEYLLKGILKTDSDSPYKMYYVVHPESKSQMTFQIIEKKDALKLAPMLNTPSSIKARITKMMDGTKGKISFPYEISNRFPDPLSSESTGIKKIKNLKCE